MFISFSFVFPALMVGVGNNDGAQIECVDQPVISAVEECKHQSLQSSAVNDKVIGIQGMETTQQLEQSLVKGPQHHCRKRGTDFLACSRHFLHESVTCVRGHQICDGIEDCLYGDDEDPTRCLFHRLSMNEMDRINFAIIKLMETIKPKKQPIIWADEEGNLRDQNGGIVS